MSFMTEGEKHYYRQGVIWLARQLVNAGVQIPPTIAERLARAEIPPQLYGMTAILENAASGQMSLSNSLPPPNRTERLETASIVRKVENTASAVGISDQYRTCGKPDLKPPVSRNEWTEAPPEFREVLDRLKARSKHTTSEEADT